MELQYKTPYLFRLEEVNVLGAFVKENEETITIAMIALYFCGIEIPFKALVHLQKSKILEIFAQIQVQ